MLSLSLRNLSFDVLSRRRIILYKLIISLRQLLVVAVCFFAMLNFVQANQNSSNIGQTLHKEIKGKTPADAKKFIKTILDEIYKELPNKKSNNSKYAYLESFTTQIFDFPYMSAWSLGTYYRTLKPADKKQYLTISRKYMVLNYGNVFDRSYQLYTFRITGAEQQGNDYLVSLTAKTKRRTSAKSDHEVIDIVWKMRYSEKKHGFYIVDVSLNNIAFMSVQRSSFQSLYNDSNQDAKVFLQKLQEKVNAKKKELGVG